jgi:phage shock protein C
MENKHKRIYKIEEGKKIFGVCGGIAEYFNIDPVIVRVIWGVCSLAYGVGIILYLVCAFVFPNKSEVE